NHEGSALNRTFQSGLPGGDYCDIQSGDTVTVGADGAFTATVAPAAGTAALCAAHPVSISDGWPRRNTLQRCARIGEPGPRGQAVEPAAGGPGAVGRPTE
ncbi:hypothetical protein ACFVGN_40830, partial [Streptomyces sp. NPDC057757]